MNSSYGLIDQSAELAAKAALMSQYMSKSELMKPVSKLAWDPYTSYAKREPFIRIIQGFEDEARMEMKAKIASTMVPLEQKIKELKAANLGDKHNVLQSLPIVSVPVGALYLGVNEADLHRLKYNCNGLFGARYLGRQCYSMEELQLIAQNPTWMHEYTMAKPQEEIELPKLAVLNHVTFVDWDIAKAFTNLTDSELSSQTRASYRNRRPYRLADLEKIRIAKLSQEAACRPTKVQSERTKFLAVEVL
jgi:hypothetical protein